MFGRFAIPFIGLRSILRYAEATIVHQAQAAHGVALSLGGRFLKKFERSGVVLAYPFSPKIEATQIILPQSAAGFGRHLIPLDRFLEVSLHPESIVILTA